PQEPVGPHGHPRHPPGHPGRPVRRVHRRGRGPPPARAAHHPRLRPLREGPRVTLAVSILNKGRLPASLRRKTPLFAAAVKKALPKARGEVAVVFMNDAEIRSLNRESLGHDYVTDVIAFNYDTPPAYGDIAVCVPQAVRQARELGHSPLEELVTLCAHGAL